MYPVPGNDRSEVACLATNNANTQQSPYLAFCGTIVSQLYERFLRHNGFRILEVCNRSIYIVNLC